MTWRVFACLCLALIACEGEPPAGQDSPTWHGHIAPLVASHCQSCHASGGPGSVAFDTYEDVRPFAPAMLAAVDAGRMPPFMARDSPNCDHQRPFVHDLRLAPADIELLARWVENEMPEGNAATAAPLPAPPDLDIESPDLVLPFPGGFLVQGTRDVFQCFVLNPENTDQTMWVNALQLVPGEPRLAHHGIIYLDVNAESEGLSSNGTFSCDGEPDISRMIMATWFPGALPTTLPEGSGIPVPPGARLVVQMHYHPIPGQVLSDPSQVQLTWSAEEPTWAALELQLGNDSAQYADGSGLQPGPSDREPGVAEFRIPAGASSHPEWMIYRHAYDTDMRIFAAGTHMHHVGVSMDIQHIPSAEPASSECLVGTPEWDFYQQRTFAYDQPVDELPVVQPGDELHLNCLYDNTLDNPALAASLAEQGLGQPVDVTLGDETRDEMCLGVFGVLVTPSQIDQFLVAR